MSEARKDGQMKGKTSDGFEYDIDREVLTDMRLLDALTELQDDEDPLAISRIASLLLGKEQKKRLYDYISEKDEKHHVPVEKVNQTLMEIFKSQAKLKNS